MQEYFLKLEDKDKLNLKILSERIEKAINNLIFDKLDIEDIKYLYILDEYVFYVEDKQDGVI